MSERGWGVRRMALCMAIGLSAFPAAFWLPPWLSGIWFALIAFWVVWGLVSVHPGACAVCGTRRGMRLPVSRKGGGYERPLWWDLRPERRSDLAWVCMDDLETYLRMRVRTQPNGPQ